MAHTYKIQHTHMHTNIEKSLFNSCSSFFFTEICNTNNIPLPQCICSTKPNFLFFFGGNVVVQKKGVKKNPKELKGLRIPERMFIVAGGRNHLLNITTE